MKCVFSVDVEDWFHILDVRSAPPIARWDAVPSSVEHDFAQLLESFRENDVRITCFFLGWLAQRCARLVKLAQSYGNEIASHGYAHQLVYEMQPEEFRRDAERSRVILEDIAGCRVLGYRAPGFSVTRKTPWFFEKLAEAGYRYDSSVFPVSRGHGGMPEADYAPHAIDTTAGEIVEFPITITKILHSRVCLFGGGYLRLAPWNLIKRGATKVLGEGRPVVFYVHPREINPDQPRLPMSYTRQFKSYVNLNTTEGKVRNILSEFEFTTFQDLVPAFSRHPLERAKAAGS